ncbi:dihydrolipoamide acetyltransferase [Myxococcota bacterium]|nr:dihydrolipoamide acetyltransferase [Myxococcota bacterium]
MHTRTMTPLAISLTSGLFALLASSTALAQAGGTDSAATAQPTATTAPADATAAPAGQPAVEDTEHAIKLRGLEERVNDLKERIFRSKARLILLRETVMNGVISGAKAVITHRNEMGSSFSLAQVSYSLDGAPIFNKTDENGDLDDKEEIELFNGSIVPGNHNLSVYLLYRGNGYGVFSYLQGYTFKIKSSYAFTAEEGKITNLKIVGYEKGGITTDLKDRPAVRYEMEVKQDVSGPAAAQPAATEKK